MNYSPPVSELLTFGYGRLSREWPDYLELGLGQEHIPELIRMATDSELSWADADSLEVWAPLHAWRTLGQLRASEVVEPLFGLLATDDDWAFEELPLVYGMIGREAIPPLARFLDDTSREYWSRIAAARGIKEVAVADPRTRGEVLSVLSRQLEQFAENDPELNGFLVSDLLDLHAVEKTSLIQRAFDADCVDPTVTGDWEDAQVDLGLMSARETPRPFFSPLLRPPEREEPRPAKGSRKSPAKKKSKRKQRKASRKSNKKHK